MAYEPKDLTGSLFENDRKETDRHPDYKGSCMIAGVEYWVAAWEKPATEGKKAFTSLAFTKKEPKPVEEPKPEPQAKPARKKTGGKFDDMEDDIPF